MFSFSYNDEKRKAGIAFFCQYVIMTMVRGRDESEAQSHPFPLMTTE